MGKITDIFSRKKNNKVSEPPVDQAERMDKIRESLEKINRLMAELKGRARYEKRNKE